MLKSPTHRALPPALLALLLAVCAPALLAGPARAAATVTLTAAVTPAAVVYPGSAVVEGSLTSDSAPVPGAPLSLLARAGGHRRLADRRLHHHGHGRRLPLLRGAVRLHRLPRRVRGRRPAGGHGRREPARAAAPDDDVPGQPLAGRVRRAARPGRSRSIPAATVVIDRRVSGVWQPLLTVTLDAQSRFALPWTPDAFGYYRLRARMDADAGHDAGVSASELVIVNRPNAHRVPLRYAHYIVIVRHEYRLYYYEHGALVRRFDVALGRPGYRTPLGYFRVYGKRKPAGGALGACAMFYRRQGGIAIHGTNRAVADPPPRPARLLARLRAHAEPPGALALRPRPDRHARAQPALTGRRAGADRARLFCEAARLAPARHVS